MWEFEQAKFLVLFIRWLKSFWFECLFCYVNQKIDGKKDSFFNRDDFSIFQPLYLGGVNRTLWQKLQWAKHAKRNLRP